MEKANVEATPKSPTEIGCHIKKDGFLSTKNPISSENGSFPSSLASPNTSEHLRVGFGLP